MRKLNPMHDAAIGLAIEYLECGKLPPEQHRQWMSEALKEIGEQLPKPVGHPGADHED